MRAGDTLTIEGFYARIRNPDRRWWQFWKPQYVTTSDLQTFLIAQEALITSSRKLVRS